VESGRLTAWAMARPSQYLQSLQIEENGENKTHGSGFSSVQDSKLGHIKTKKESKLHRDLD
jgi:hypothetical protein